MTTSTSQNTDFVVITGGPSAGEIWDAAKYAFSNRFTVVFSGVRHRGHLTNTVRIEMQVLGVRHEDGSGDSFIVNANVISQKDDPAFRGVKEFYYKARRRSGHLSLTR